MGDGLFHSLNRHFCPVHIAKKNFFSFSPSNLNPCLIQKFSASIKTTHILVTHKQISQMDDFVKRGI